MAFNLERGAELREKWDVVPAHVDVLITHGPPHGVWSDPLKVVQICYREFGAFCPLERRTK